MQLMVFRGKDVAPGIIKLNDLILDPDVSLDDQLDELKEDLFHAVFPNDLVLDIGWYPEFEARGRFGVLLYRGCDTYDAVASRRCRSIPELKAIVAEMVAIATGEFKGVGSQ